MSNFTKTFCLLLLGFIIMHPVHSYATNYAVSGGHTPVGPATVCPGAVTYSCTDTEISCNIGGGGNTNIITWQWYYDGSIVIPGATGTYTATGTSNTVTLSSLPLLSAGTHTLYCSFTTDQFNCGYYNPIASPALVITVGATPSAITGNHVICSGTATYLSDATTGGAWSSSNTAIATVNSSGVVYGVTGGSANISYAVGGGCASFFAVASLPAIMGSNSVCASSTTYLSDAAAGGVWSSSNTTAATISGAGVVYGITTGSTNISYTSGGCAVGEAVTVDATIPAITGTTRVCTGSVGYVSDATIGGVWSSSNTTIATVSGSGIVTGGVNGSVNILYTSGGCSISRSINVSGSLAEITGSSIVCTGATINLSDVSVSGSGTWTSSNTAVAIVSATGVVSCITSGTTNISYSTASCTNGRVETVNPPIAAITGQTNVCAGSTITLSDVTAGGTWSFGSTAIATVSGSGVVTGVSGGTDSLYYATGSSCPSVLAITVPAIIAPITGSGPVCTGSTINLYDGTISGAWSSSNTTVATISVTGVVSSISAGTSIISYTVGSCSAVKTLTINPLPAAIAGPADVCVGSIIQLSNATPGGTWRSDYNTVATIDSVSGIVTGVNSSPTYAVIYYTLPTGCHSTTTITVNSVSPITGTQNICANGSNITLHDGTSGGVWSTGTSGIATISGTGKVTAITAGVADLTYTIPATGCTTVATLTVNPLPAPITGDTGVCPGSTIALSDATAGGIWSNGDRFNPIATVGSTTGIVTGIIAGETSIYYTVSGCVTSMIVQVYAPPVPEICVVNVDSATGKNIVVWDQFVPNRVARFNIYRLSDSSVFVKIDSQAANVFSTFIDTGSYPALQSYSYELTATDSCGNESSLNDGTVNTTMHLTAGLGLGSIVNLNWNVYQGEPVITQNVMRSAGGAPYVNIVSLANNVTSYTDTVPPPGHLTYVVNSVMATACTPAARTTSGGNEIVSSNPVYVNTIVTNSSSVNSLVDIYPNPATTSLTITCSETITDITITNAIGQKVYSHAESTQQLQLNVAAFGAGIYFVKVNGKDVRKFVKK